MDDDAGRALAATLRRIRDDALKRTQGGRPIWYRGAEIYFDVFFEIDDDYHLIWFQFTRSGRVVTWNRSTGRAWTGNTNEFDVSSPPHSATRTIEEDTHFDERTITDCVKVMAAREEVEFAEAVKILRDCLAAGSAQ